MSLGYADRLKQRKNLGGQLGAKEYHQSFEEIKEGVQTLAQWISEAKRVFVFTGAGISTSCGIPDFRGPNGIWTLRKKKLPVPSNFTPFEYAKPSFTHMAISALVAAGKVPYVCSQNVDSLHLWSGVPRQQLAELHGNCFAERCSVCRTEYARDFQMETVNFRPSGRRCPRPGCCGAPLLDNILDWDTPLPEDELSEAVQQAEEADVSLVLGTSLQIQPANEIPTLTRDEGGKMVIVNLQKTPKDRKAALILRSRVDLAMALLMQQLGMQVPPYIRTEALVVEHTLGLSPSAAAVTSLAAATAPAASTVAADSSSSSSSEGRALTICIRSCHGGPGCPLPMVESLSISVSASDPRAPDAAGAGAPAGADVSVSTTAAAGLDGAEAAAASGSGRTWGPHSSGDLSTSPDPAAAASAGTGASASASAGASATSASTSASGAPFSHTFPGVPHWTRRVRCTLRVRLVRWADEDKRDVTIQHDINLDALAAGNLASAPPPAASSLALLIPPPAAAGPTATDSGGGGGGGARVATGPHAAAAASLAASTAGDVAATSSAATAGGSSSATSTTAASTHVHSFVSQRVDYDPAQVFAAFLANPPPVVQPEPPRKRHKSGDSSGGGGAGGTAASAARPTRTSQRLTRATYKAQRRASESPSTGPSVDSESDDEGDSA